MTPGERLYKYWSEWWSDVNVIVVFVHREIIALMSLLDRSPETFESQLDMLVLMLWTVGICRGVLRGGCVQ